VVIAGGHGLLGTALRSFLTTGGHPVRLLGRAGSRPDPAGLEGAHVVINLAGAGIADERWTDHRKALLRESRVAFTEALVAAVRKLPRPPQVFLQGSAVGVYGERGDEVLTESSEVGAPGPRAAAYLARLCAEWESAGLRAQGADTRVVLLRTGLVQTANGGALARLLVPFRAGAGGPIGGASGRAGSPWRTCWAPSSGRCSTAP
jgi:hypothetical protein